MGMPKETPRRQHSISFSHPNAKLVPIPPKGRRKPPDIEKIRAPYVAAIGKVVWEWNRLQEYLGLLFCNLFPHHSFGAQVAWHSLKSDLAQREMLLAVAKNILPQTSDKPEKLLSDIEWIIGKMNGFNDNRVNTVHSPYAWLSDKDGMSVVPLVIFGNPKARKLPSKNLLPELEWYEKFAATMSSFVYQVHYAQTVEPTPWPDRPQLPVLQNVQKVEKRTRRSARRQSARPPHASEN
jgi:hypothetical protein